MCSVASAVIFAIKGACLSGSLDPFRASHCETGRDNSPSSPRVALVGDSGGTPRRRPQPSPGCLRRPPPPPATVRAAAAARGRAEAGSPALPTPSSLSPTFFLLPPHILVAPRRRRLLGPDPASSSPDPGPQWPDLPPRSGVGVPSLAAPPTSRLAVGPWPGHRRGRPGALLAAPWVGGGAPGRTAAVVAGDARGRAAVVGGRGALVAASPSWVAGGAPGRAMGGRGRSWVRRRRGRPGLRRPL